MSDHFVTLCIKELNQDQENFGSSRSQMFLKISLQNLANYTAKHLCWSLFLIKLQA